LASYRAWVHPALLEYQPWREVADEARALPPSEPSFLVDVPPTSALSFDAQRPLTTASVKEAMAHPPPLFVGSDAALGRIEGATILLRLPEYPVSILRGPFLGATTVTQVEQGQGGAAGRRTATPRREGETPTRRALSTARAGRLRG
jgi:hypothetical protein